MLSPSRFSQLPTSIGQTKTQHEEEEEEEINKDTIKQTSERYHVDLPMNTLDVMLKQEANVYRSQCIDGLDEIGGNDHVMDWLPQMTQFCFTLVDCCELPLQSVEVAMNLLDRFLFGNDTTTMPLASSSLSVSSFTRREILSDSTLFQLATLTCLYISTKLLSSKCLTMAHMERLSEATTEDIQSMELQILSQLHFQINPPTIVSFAQQYVQEELQIWSEDHDRSLFLHLVEKQARLAACKLYSFHVPVSSIALACVKNAVEVMEAHHEVHPFMISSPTYERTLTRLEEKIRTYYFDDQRDISLVQEQLQSRLRGTALEAMEKLRSLEEERGIAVDDALWLSDCSAPKSITKASSSPATVIVSS